MSYRIVKITSYYKDFLSYYYQRFPELDKLNYKEQHQHLMTQRFAWSDAYARAFTNLHYDAHEIVANAIPLQKLWANENGVRFEDEKSLLIEQLKVLKPEIVWLQDSYSFNGDFIKALKGRVPSVKLVMGNCCSPISTHYTEGFKVFDLITVCAPYFKDLMEERGLGTSVFVPHAFDERILDEIKGEQEKHDFLFTGSLILDQFFHKERITFLEQLVNDKVDLNLLINLNDNSSKSMAIRQLAFILSRSLDKTGLGFINQKINGLNKVSKLEYFPRSSKVSKSLKRLIKEPVFGIEMFTEMANSNVTFNIHGDIAKNFAANMRLYEATGAGSCLLTDWKPDLANYFADDEVVAYKSIAEAKEKLSWLLNHPEEMKSIAAKGQKRTLKDHNFKNRAAIIDEAIKKKMNKL